MKTCYCGISCDDDCNETFYALMQMGNLSSPFFASRSMIVNENVNQDDILLRNTCVNVPHLFKIQTDNQLSELLDV